jgi:hypothetical protein
MGQKQPVQVFILITEETIEENLLSTLAAKQELFLAALDVESDVDQVDLQSGMEELRRRLEILLGARPEAPRDESMRIARESEAAAVAQAEQVRIPAGVADVQVVPDSQRDTDRQVRREKLAVSGGQLLTAAFQFLDQLLPPQDDPTTCDARSNRLASNLKQCLFDLVDHDEQGRPRLTLSLPDASALDNLANTLGRFLGHAEAKLR